MGLAQEALRLAERSQRVTAVSQRVPGCEQDAIDLLGYTDAQMRSAIEELIVTEVPVKEPVA